MSVSECVCLACAVPVPGVTASPHKPSPPPFLAPQAWYVWEGGIQSSSPANATDAAEYVSIVNAWLS